MASEVAFPGLKLRMGFLISCMSNIVGLHLDKVSFAKWQVGVNQVVNLGSW